MLRTHFSQYLEVHHAMGKENGNLEKELVLVIRKLAGAPAALPMLDKQTIMQITDAANNVHGDAKVIPIPTIEEEKRLAKEES